MMDVAGLLGFLLASLAAAMTGAFFRPGEWYERLAKPWWRPPNWLFGPAWLVLYTLIAVAGWLVWRKVGLTGAPLAFGLFALQLVLNALWSLLFFGLRRMDLAFVGVTSMWAAILATIIAFAAIDTTAALLLVPYLVWVTFAAALNWTIWQLNPNANGSKDAQTL